MAKYATNPLKWDIIISSVFETLTRLSIVLLIEAENIHHQPINVPTAGAQAFLMDYTYKEENIKKCLYWYYLPQ
jgi:hypothetical protein